MFEAPDNKNRPEDDRDMFIEDFEHTHRFTHTMSNSIFREITEGTGELGTFAENALKVWTHANSKGISIDQAGVELGLDFEDATHQSYMQVASDLDYYYYNDGRQD